MAQSCRPVMGHQHRADYLLWNRLLGNNSCVETFVYHCVPALLLFCLETVYWLPAADLMWSAAEDWYSYSGASQSRHRHRPQHLPLKTQQDVQEEISTLPIKAPALHLWTMTPTELLAWKAAWDNWCRGGAGVGRDHTNRWFKLFFFPTPFLFLFAADENVPVCQLTDRVAELFKPGTSAEAQTPLAGRWLVQDLGYWCPSMAWGTPLRTWPGWWSGSGWTSTGAGGPTARQFATTLRTF